MSLSTEETFFTAARSRRLACDRCHRHKLRCERSPVIVNGSISVPLGSCKRCMKARVPCQTVSGTFTTVGSGSGPQKRKSQRAADTSTEKKAEEATSMTVSDASFPGPPETTRCETTLYGTNSPPSFNSTETSMFDADAFDLVTGEFIGVDSGTTSSGTLSSPVHVRSPLNSCSLLLDDEPGGDGGTQVGMMVDHASEAQVQYEGFVNLTCCSVTANQNHGSPDASTVSQTDRQTAQGWREDCRRRLIELHSLVFNGLHCVTHTDLCDALFSPDSTGISGHGKPGPGDNIVRRVLFASERLIELLALIREADTNRRRNGLNCKPGSPHREQRASSAIVRHPAVPDGGGIPIVGTVNGSIPETRASSSEAFLDGSPSFVDLPIIVSFLTCYVGLLSVYRAIFTHIHEALRSSEPIRPRHGHHQRPWTAPASRTHRGSQQPYPHHAVLINQHILGIRIQMEVMTHMLEQVDDAWAGATMERGSEAQAELMVVRDGRDNRGQQLVNSPATMALLSQMLLHEGYEDSDCMDDGCRMGLGNLMSIQRSIRRLLRTSNFGESI